MTYNTRQTFRIFWQHVTQFWKSGLLTAVLVIGASSVFVVIPYLYKTFFDVLASSASRPELLRILWYIFLALLVHHVLWRTAIYASSYFQASVMREISNTCFRYLHRHSFSFFQNNFVGSLVTKVKRYYRSFEGIADMIIFF